MKLFLKISTLALAISMALPAVAATQNLVVNGGFEDSTFSGVFTTYVAGSTSLTGWTIETGSVDLIKSYGIKAGLSIKPNTPAESIFEFLPYLDLVLVMTVEPGFGGQEFLHDCAKKIPVIRQNAPEKLVIQVDGGINNVTGKIVPVQHPFLLSNYLQEF